MLLLTQAHSPTKSGWDSADTESYRRIQMLALRKVRGIVRFWSPFAWLRELNTGKKTIRIFYINNTLIIK